LTKLDITKTSGSDEIKPKCLKLAVLIISTVLTQMFNLIMAKSDLKVAIHVVIPIHKCGPKADNSDYRSISILPTTSLFLERHVNYWLKIYLETNSLLYERQSRFREHRSCQTALAKIIDDWLTGIDKNMVSGSLFVDLSKAFDLVNHKLLIDKLQLYNIDTPRFSSYLQTYFSGAMSDKKAVISGVPQGSVLGPILFLIYNLYIHDLPLSLTRTL